MNGGRRVRPHEILLAAYFGVTAVMIAVRGLPDREWVPLLLLHLAVVAVALLGLPQLGDRGAGRVLRAWLPVLALPIIYKEVAVLNSLFASGYHDAGVQALETAVFGGHPAVTLRAALPWKPLSEYLHFGYFGYYALFPILGGTLFLQRRFSEFDQALTVTLGTFFVCYVVFIVYPVAGPWYHFTRPDPLEVGWVFPGLIHAVLEKGAAQGAAFPSSHAAAAVAMWLLSWGLHRRVFLVLSAIVPALVVGTVYGGFHYAVDAIAGVAVGVACLIVFTRLHRMLSRGADTEPPSVRQRTLPRPSTRARATR